MDQSAIDDLFERNADMRLLEFRNADPAKGALQDRRARPSFGAESIISATPDVEIEKAPRLRVAIAAAPASGVIPGAVVGVAIDVFNDGNAPAPESKLVLSLPLESQFRSGSLRIDGREVAGPEQLFSSGLPVARLPGGTSAKVTFQLAILPGVNTLYLQPRLQTDGVPVVGTVGISIKRGASAGASGEAARPFYELEDDETGELALTEPELPPVLPPVTAPAPPAPKPAATTAPPPAPVPDSVAPDPEPVAVVPVAPPAEPPAQLELETVTLEAAPAVREPEPPEPEPEPAKAPRQPKMTPAGPPKAVNARPEGEERMLRYRSLAANDLALLERLFSAPVPGLIAHYVMISTIACTEPNTGMDTSGYSPFLQRDIELLGRALVHSRMGKAPQYQIVQSDLASLSLPWDLTPQTFPPQRRLRRDLRKAEWAAIGGLMQPSERDATLRTRIALLALAASSIDGVERRTGDEAATALAGYRSSVLAWLVPLCVASASSPSFEIPPPPANVDAAGKALAAALKNAFTT